MSKLIRLDSSDNIRINGTLVKTIDAEAVSQKAKMSDKAIINIFCDHYKYDDPPLPVEADQNVESFEDSFQHRGSEVEMDFHIYMKSGHVKITEFTIAVK